MGENEESYVKGHKARFKSLFNVEADENLTAFTNYLLSKAILELAGDIDNLKSKINELIESDSLNRDN